MYKFHVGPEQEVTEDRDAIVVDSAGQLVVEQADEALLKGETA